MNLERWKGRRVRLNKNITAKVMVGRQLAVKTDEWGSTSPMTVCLMKGETFTVIGHHQGRLDLLYQPRKMPEKAILHVKPSDLEIQINDTPVC